MKNGLISFIVVANLVATAYIGYKVLPHDMSNLQPVPKPVTIDEPVVMQTKGGLLEVSIVTATEHFLKSTTHTILGVPVGTTIAQIRVPATYRYHIELAPQWKMLKQKNALIVIAPEVRPSLPVAFDSSGIQAQVNGLWSPITGPTVLNGLQKAITPQLNLKSTAKPYIDLQREVARKTVHQFVNKWVMSDEKWKGAGLTEVHVFFADESIDRLKAAAGL